MKYNAIIQHRHHHQANPPLLSITNQYKYYWSSVNIVDWYHYMIKKTIWKSVPGPSG